ncbi:LAMI_0G14642g1_1 [Lachancea mirantina]|uniref:LAMI_0G14642g1_1 n=1 Tax=Lachancea mirantina TaxID=1230905 RepID=A0A1G4KC78_9SACH|nr:LAMI_0G14642g1_1 [Lachancea mirantina]
MLLSPKRHTSLDCLPVELRLRLLSENPQLKVVGRSWYRLSNQFYRDLCLSVKTWKFWLEIQKNATLYVKSLDDYRRAARLINNERSFLTSASDTTDFIEYLCDSWHILYCVLFKWPRLFFETPFGEPPESWYRKQEVTGSIEICERNLSQCGLWIKILKTPSLLKMLKVRFTVRYANDANGDARIIEKTLPVFVDDWCKFPGIYYISLGTLEICQASHVSKNRRISLCQVNAKLETTAQNRCTEYLRPLGLDFVPYQQGKPVILAHTDEESFRFSGFEGLLYHSAALRGSELLELTTDVGSYDQAGHSRRQAKFEVRYRFPRDKQTNDRGIKNVDFPYLG